MENKIILLTGGAGFIGSHLADELISKNNRIIILDSLISSSIKYIRPHINGDLCKFIEADIRKMKNFDLIDENIDIIFHLAADPDVKSSVDNPVASFNHNVSGTLNVLEFARSNDVDSFVFASSGGTLYGDVDVFPISEETVLKPISPYGASKAACEMYISAYSNAYNIKSVSGRLANILGERSNHGVCYDFYMKLKKDPKKLEILGNGLQQKSYLHVSDCVDALIKLGESTHDQKLLFDYFNIGSNEWVNVNYIAQLVESEMLLQNVEHVYTGGEKGWIGDIHKLLLSVEKVKERVNWIPKISIEDSIKRYIAWLDTNI